MEYRILGRTGVTVSNLCLGAMMFGPWGDPDHDNGIGTTHRALDALRAAGPRAAALGCRTLSSVPMVEVSARARLFEKDIPEYDDEAADLDLDDLL